MTVREDILAGKYVPNLPLKDAPVTVGDWQFAQIARIDVYPVGYDPFAKDEPGKPKIVRLKPTYEWYLDLITPDKGVVRQRIDVKDRQEAEAMLSAEVERIEDQLYDDLADEYHVTHGTLGLLYGMAKSLRLKGLIAVADEWTRLFPLTQVNN
jgi:hypothetical protein